MGSLKGGNKNLYMLLGGKGGIGELGGRGGLRASDVGLDELSKKAAARSTERRSILYI